PLGPSHLRGHQTFEMTKPRLAAVTPINDLHGPEAPALAKGERLMRCKVGSIHRLLDLYGWAQLGHAAVTVS
uniref:Uncharacterized protein n=1 Tax=Otus sunia TaxID=257818 RepID=A0A8C8AAX9_9STRI